MLIGRLQVVAEMEVEALESQFTTQVHDALIWTPPHHDHAHWVAALVARLLRSDAVRGPVLRHLGEVCEVEVSSRSRSNT